MIAIINRAFLSDKPDIRSQEEFQLCLEKGRAELIPVANQLCKIVSEILSEFHVVRKRLDGKTSLAWLSVIKSIKEQLNNLIYPGFVNKTQKEWLQHLPRYIKAIDKRLDKLEYDPAKDKTLDLIISSYWRKYTEEHASSDRLINYRWMIEEFRVSLFAQESGTSCPVSEKRLEKLWDEYKKGG